MTNNIEELICFKLYACAKEITRKYEPYLKRYDLTYTQYIVILALYEYKKISIKDLGMKMFLDSGTLSPLLKKLEDKGLIIREKNSNDDRVFLFSLSDKGICKYNETKDIHKQVGACLNLSKDDKNYLMNEVNCLLANVEK
jgi:MarR family transcriptional regulator, organic hydroperoxide resistance regulator